MGYELNILFMNGGNSGGGAEKSTMACLDGYERFGQAAWLIVGSQKLF